jgi:serine/threonine protein kinase
MNRYIVEKRLGEGAFGLVFLAIHKDSGRRVAIKRMRRSFSSWEECLKLREVQILQNVRHPGIVELLEVFREKERLHLVFEYVVGFW